MTELLAFSRESPLLAFVILCLATFFAGSTLWAFASSLGTIERRTQTVHIHHHHSMTCRNEHQEGPCRED